LAHRKTLSNLLKLVRAYEWIDKLQLNFIAAFILIIYLSNPIQYFSKIIILGLYIIFLGSYGYVINSYADRESDSKVGKHSESLYFSKRQIRSILVVFAIPSIAIPLSFPDTRIWILGITTFLLVTFYSLRPLRFKERGTSGIITAALTQRTLPFLLFVFLIPNHNSIIAYFLLFWLSLIGIAIIMTHQFSDFEKDLKSGVNTWAVERGKRSVKNWINSILTLILVCVLAPIIIFPLYEGATISLIILAFSGYAIGDSVYAMRSLELP
jgi:4-hydroxybenzoate polyprenyltransferase